MHTHCKQVWKFWRVRLPTDVPASVLVLVRMSYAHFGLAGIGCAFCMVMVLCRCDQGGASAAAAGLRTWYSCIAWQMHQPRPLARAYHSLDRLCTPITGLNPSIRHERAGLEDVLWSSVVQCCCMMVSTAPPCNLCGTCNCLFVLLVLPGLHCCASV